MYFIDPHVHMVTRTTDDYQALAHMDCLAVSEPAFWPGFDRAKPESFYDYFRQLVEFEPTRAARYGIAHYCWLCVNAKEAEHVTLAREVLQFLPEFLDRPNVLGIGEIGLNKNTRNEALVFWEHVQLAMKHDRLILIHTPHLEDKYPGTRMILDMLADERRIRPERVLVDHVEEHTIRHVLDAGYWAGMTLYPITKCTPQRAADLVECYGPERLLVNSSGDWGPSRPTAVRDFIQEMRMRGHSESFIQQIVLDNPVTFFSQHAGFALPQWYTVGHSNPAKP